MFIAVLCTHAGLITLIAGYSPPLISSIRPAPVFAVLIAAPLLPASEVAPLQMPVMAAPLSLPNPVKPEPKSGIKLQTEIKKPPPQPVIAQKKIVTKPKLTLERPKLPRKLDSNMVKTGIKPKTPDTEMPVDKSALAAEIPSAISSNDNLSSSVVPAVRPSTIIADYRVAYLHNPPPVYPASSRQQKEEGRVLLNVMINSNGKPEVVQIQQSSGYSALDQSATDTVRRWRFAPAQRSGTPVDAWVTVPIVFRFSNSRPLEKIILINVL
jgi:protein TonB